MLWLRASCRACGAEVRPCWICASRRAANLAECASVVGEMFRRLRRPPHFHKRLDQEQAARVFGVVIVVRRAK